MQAGQEFLRKNPMCGSSSHSTLVVDASAFGRKSRFREGREV
jgi:hypothetical protein